jgi:hypothetical protein
MLGLLGGTTTATGWGATPLQPCRAGMKADGQLCTQAGADSVYVFTPVPRYLCDPCRCASARSWVAPCASAPTTAPCPRASCPTTATHPGEWRVTAGDAGVGCVERKEVGGWPPAGPIPAAHPVSEYMETPNVVRPVWPWCDPGVTCVAGHDITCYVSYCLLWTPCLYSS